MSDEITVRASASVSKETQCSACLNTYYYQMTRATSASRHTSIRFGSEKAEQKAREVAEARLVERLATEVDPVPCPSCGAYQPEMFEGIRRKKFKLLWVATIVLICFGCISLFATGVCATSVAKDRSYETPLTIAGVLTGLCFVGAIAARVLYKSKKASYDPNSQAIEDRMVIARNRAVTSEQRDRILAQESTAAPPAAAPKPWQTGRKGGAS